MPRRQRLYSEPSVVDREAKTPQVVVARGELSINDRSLLTGLLARFGLTTEYVLHDEFIEQERAAAAFALSFQQDPPATRVSSELVDSPFAFSLLTHPDQFIVREHLENFKDIHETQLPTAFVGRTFNFLVDGNGRQRQRTTAREFEPAPPDGIVLATREELGIARCETSFESYGKNKHCSRYAVQAAGVVALSEAYAEKGSQCLTSPQKNVLLVGIQLQQQFQNAPQ